MPLRGSLRRGRRDHRRRALGECCGGEVTRIHGAARKGPEVPGYVVDQEVPDVIDQKSSYLIQGLVDAGAVFEVPLRDMRSHGPPLMGAAARAGIVSKDLEQSIELAFH